MNALFQIKQSLTEFLNLHKTKRLHRLTSAHSNLCFSDMDAKKANSEQLERVQKLATRWILGPDKGYYERLDI